jgi:hypothetical protein
MRTMRRRVRTGDSEDIFEVNGTRRGVVVIGRERRSSSGASVWSCASCGLIACGRATPRGRGCGRRGSVLFLLIRGFFALCEERRESGSLVSGRMNEKERRESVTWGGSGGVFASGLRKAKESKGVGKERGPRGKGGKDEPVMEGEEGR